MTRPYGTKNVTLYLFFLSTLRICLSIINSSKRQEFFRDYERIFLFLCRHRLVFSILSIDKYHLVSCISLSEIRSKQNIHFLQPKNILSLTLYNISRLYRLERNLLQEKASQLSTRMLDIEDENNELKEQVTSKYYI